jgi:hypothetical protein
VTDVTVPPLKLGGCTDIRGTRESLIVAAKRNENVVFYSLEPKYPLIDFVYRNAITIYAFQVTIGADHSCDSKYLKAAFEEAGSEYELLLHYLTYGSKYKGFVLKPVNPFETCADLVKRSGSNDWTIRVIRVPGPDEDHGGRSICDTRVKVERNANVTVPELKSQLRALGLPITGTKAVLLERLSQNTRTDESG